MLEYFLKNACTAVCICHKIVKWIYSTWENSEVLKQEVFSFQSDFSVDGFCSQFTTQTCIYLIKRGKKWTKSEFFLSWRSIKVQASLLQFFSLSHWSNQTLSHPTAPLFSFPQLFLLSYFWLQQQYFIGSSHISVFGRQSPPINGILSYFTNCYIVSWLSTLSHHVQTSWLIIHAARQINSTVLAEFHCAFFLPSPEDTVC